MKSTSCKENIDIVTTMYFIGRETLFFTNNSLTECRITIEFLPKFFRP